MSKLCPLTKERVLYLECQECDRKEECVLGLLYKDNEKGIKKNED